MEPSGQEHGTSEGDEFTFGDNAPAEWRGKGPDYAVQEYTRLANGVRQYLTQLQNQGQMPTQPQSPASFQPQTETNVNQNNTIDPDLLVTNPAEWQKQFQINTSQQFQNYLNQAVQPMLAGQAESAKALSKADPGLRKIWDKYGPEVEQIANSVHPSYRGNKALWDSAAKLVASQHVDEIAQERAQELAASMRGTTETGSTRFQGPTNVKDEIIEKLQSNDYGKRILEKHGIGKIKQTAEAMGTTLEKYVDMVAGTNVIRDPEKPGEWHNREIMRDTNG